MFCMTSRMVVVGSGVQSGVPKGGGGYLEVFEVGSIGSPVLLMGRKSVIRMFLYVFINSPEHSVSLSESML